MTKIGDGVCTQACNNPFCLNDGGDCLTPTNQHQGGSHAFQARDKNVLDFRYRAFFPLQQGEKLRQNPWYNFSKTQRSTTTLCGVKPRKIPNFTLKISKPKLSTHFQQKTAKFRYGDRSEIIFKDSILTPLVAIQILGSRAMVRFFSFSYFDN